MAMISPFDKALEQVARGSKPNRTAAESREQKVRRLEELIRAKEATGDRIVMGIGAALVVSAMALPVYAALLRDGYVSLPGIGSPSFMRSGSTAPWLQEASQAYEDAVEATGSITPSANAPETTSARYQEAAATPFSRYVIHRATKASALIEGPNGLWWVTPGMKIPGIGQILAIVRSEAGWAVVTSETTITEAASGYAGY
ncbi:hypothetical protein [Microvirga makkahensis]|uniref:Uncharacterized protein n=1 Tax=Microvirga makkahensis TaxID=1128670 RepID=A0A7X3MR46_9HYPH|nr:hypothetical protein [Microvirga makkahensis]MXQ11693.1 hypothetical protein [Microvirga makkahensis]